MAVSKLNAKKVIFITTIVVSLALSAFLSVSLVVYYFKNVKQQTPLIYTFDTSTSKYRVPSKTHDDIGEEFLSYGISYGIDVSEWQGTINWEKVAHSGISFAMIRCGFRQIKGDDIIVDATFKENVEGATKAGLNVGVYFFGTAKNEKEAIEEAEFVIDLIKNYDIDYPIAYDAETFDGRLKYTSSEELSKSILAFTETVSSYGYDTMIYSYKNAFYNNLDTGLFDGKMIWLAHYIDQTDYKGNYHMWQYSDNGSVDGIDTKVDLNISYFTYVDTEKDIRYDPNYKIEPKVSFEQRDDIVKTVQSVKMRSSATYELPNTLGTIPYNTELKRTGISDNFSRVLYNERIVYIDNDYLRVVS